MLRKSCFVLAWAKFFLCAKIHSTAKRARTLSVLVLRWPQSTRGVESPGIRGSNERFDPERAAANRAPLAAGHHRGAGSYTIHRKAADATFVDPEATLPGTDTSFVDTNIAFVGAA